MEGKSLAAAYCGEAAPANVADSGPAVNVLTLDFGHSKPPSPGPTKPVAEPLLAPLDRFIVGDQGIEWHDPADGLAVVGGILVRLREGAMISLAEDFEFFDRSEEALTNEVISDLEDLVKILISAQRADVRFCLAFDI